ncbi:MAG: GntR family transcriptional regulator [Bacteroides sp.]|nr:GntR family transcriptional regulator [Bacteroides sp.]
MKLNFGHQATKVKQLADSLAGMIEAGELRTGELLPSINMLSKQHAVSRDTVFKAFMDLKERDMIDSTPGKGYYVTGRLKNILLVLDEYSPFKDVLYNSFTQNLKGRYKVDLLFHQYNERLFNTIIRESAGRYNRYLITNIKYNELNPIIRKIDRNKVLLLDLGEFDKENYFYICQDFQEEFYKSLIQIQEKVSNYKEFLLYSPEGCRHPESSIEWFERFSEEHHLSASIISEERKLNVQQGQVYIAFRQQDVVTIIKETREKRLTCGKEFGLIAYNDTPLYEIIDQGITALSIDWTEMGKMAADFVLNSQPVQITLPLRPIIRNSI